MSKYNSSSITRQLSLLSLFENTAEETTNTGNQFRLTQQYANRNELGEININTEESDIGRPINLMQMNGRRVLGPPEDWLGPPPSSACELFVRRIPRDIDEQKLLTPFLRFGRIYEIRLPVNFNQEYRGFAYVKYTNKEDASRAMEVLNHLFITPLYKLEIMHSQEKCHLFVSNIPKKIDEYEIEQKLRSIFPTMQRIHIRSPFMTKNSHTNRSSEERKISRNSNTNNLNFIQYFTTNTKFNEKKMNKSVLSRNNNNVENYSSVEEKQINLGYAFIEFPSHLHALEAKKSVNPGIIRLWDTDLKVVWANTDRDNNFKKMAKTLFMRNIDVAASNNEIIKFLSQYVSRNAIGKVAKVRNAAYICFNTRETAEYCLRTLQRITFKDRRLEIEWAKSLPQQTTQVSRNTDYDAVLRLKCIANDWGIPIIIFGAYYEQQNLQYAAVMIRDNNRHVRLMICILDCSDLNDIHSRLCEVACSLIEIIGSFPDYNYVFYVEKDLAHLLGIVTISLKFVDFMGACGVPNEFSFDLREIMDITCGIVSLSYINETNLLNMYMEVFRNGYMYGFLNNLSVANDRVFGAIMPKYRNKPNLKYNINDTQVVLAYCFKSNGSTKFPSERIYMPISASVYDAGYNGLGYIRMKLVPLPSMQSQNNSLNYVLYNGDSSSYTNKYISVPQSWLTACSFFESIYQPVNAVDNSKVHLQLAVSPLNSLELSSTSNLTIGLPIPLNIASTLNPTHQK